MAGCVILGNMVSGRMKRSRGKTVSSVLIMFNVSCLWIDHYYIFVDTTNRIISVTILKSSFSVWLEPSTNQLLQSKLIISEVSTDAQLPG